MHSNICADPVLMSRFVSSIEDMFAILHGQERRKDCATFI